MNRKDKNVDPIVTQSYLDERFSRSLLEDSKNKIDQSLEVIMLKLDRMEKEMKERSLAFKSRG